MILAYTALLYLLLPYVLFHLLWRSRRQPDYLRHWGERFGRYEGEPPSQPLIWVHTVSVGETRAAAPLVRALQAQYPGCRILLTHMTPTGRATGEQLFGVDVERCYLPYDYPFAVRRFLVHFRPCIGVLLETEIWPNLIHACQEQGVPLCLLNARLSEKSARAYARLGGLTAASLRRLAAIAAQTEADAARFHALGAGNVSIMGNIKFDSQPDPAMLEQGKSWRVRWGRERPVFLAASTREGEEEIILDALEQIVETDLLCVIVPRHPQRFDEVARLLHARGIAFQRRSDDRVVDGECRVLLGDSMGEMFAYYAACDLTLIGGSLLPLGGQNLIEACAVGKPVLIGPHTFNFAEASASAVAEGAALRVADGGALVQALSMLLNDPALRARMARAGLDFSRRHQGATARAMSLLSPHLAATAC